MLYVKVRGFSGDRVICECTVCGEIEFNRARLPHGAAVGDAYTISLNAEADGLDVVRICDKAWRKQRRKVEEIRKERRKKHDELKNSPPEGREKSAIC